MAAVINIDQVASDAVQKMLQILTGAGHQVASYATAEAKKLTTSAAEIAALRISGKIDDEEMALHLEIQKHASRAVLTAIAGISLIAAEQAINAALGVIADAIKTATGLSLFV